jgi:hypothetical protein
MNRYYEPTEEEMDLVQVSVPDTALGMSLMLFSSALIILAT